MCDWCGCNLKSKNIVIRKRNCNLSYKSKMYYPNLIHKFSFKFKILINELLKYIENIYFVNFGNTNYEKIKPIATIDEVFYNINITCDAFNNQTAIKGALQMLYFSIYESSNNNCNLLNRQNIVVIGTHNTAINYLQTPYINFHAFFNNNYDLVCHQFFAAHSVNNINLCNSANNLLYLENEITCSLICFNSLTFNNKTYNSAICSQLDNTTFYFIYKINIVSPYSITQNYAILFNLLGNIYKNENR